MTRLPKRGRAHWTEQRVPVQFFPHIPGADPLSEPNASSHPNDAESERQKRLEYITAIAERLFATQQRLFLFMLVIVGRRFRLIRWDRAGIVATPPKDYYEQPAVLCDSLRRLSLLDDTSVGFDPSATRLLARDADFLRMDMAAAENAYDLDRSERVVEKGDLGDVYVFRYVRSLFRDSLDSDWPRYRMQVPDGDRMRDYLVGKPIFQESGVTGRGTRGYVAFECETGRFVWLKDTWRASVLIAEREGDILHHLNQAGVENIPTLVCHGDVYDHATVTDLWWKRKYATSSTPLRLPSSSLPESSFPAPDSSHNRKRKRGQQEDGRSHVENQQDPSTTFGLDSCPPSQRHTHYRMVVQEVAMPLDNIQSGKQLVSVVLDCLRGEVDSIAKMPCP